MLEGKSDAERQKIGDAIHEALIETWKIPLNDRFQIFHEKKKSHFDMDRFIWNVNRSDNLLVIHITTSPRTKEMKLNFYKRLPEILNEKANIRPEDVFISIISNNVEDWSFGNGEAQLVDSK